jgi:hypothetical protein
VWRGDDPGGAGVGLESPVGSGCREIPGEHFAWLTSGRKERHQMPLAFGAAPSVERTAKESWKTIFNEGRRRRALHEIPELL